QPPPAVPHEATTVMPAWQPPAAVPAAPAEAPPIGGPTRPLRPASAAHSQAELTIESGPDAGHAHRAGDSALRLGRSPDNDRHRPPAANRRHHTRQARR